MIRSQLPSTRSEKRLRFFFDSNIFIYAANERSDEFFESRELFAQCYAIEEFSWYYDWRSEIAISTKDIVDQDVIIDKFAQGSLLFSEIQRALEGCRDFKKALIKLLAQGRFDKVETNSDLKSRLGKCGVGKSTDRALAAAAASSDEKLFVTEDLEDFSHVVRKKVKKDKVLRLTILSASEALNEVEKFGRSLRNRRSAIETSPPRLEGVDDLLA